MTPMTILGTGVALPGLPIPSAFLAEKLDLSPEWAEHFIGTRSRYLALDLESGEQFESLETLGASAAYQALQRSGMNEHQLDFIILATATPDELMPSTANRIAVRLGLSHIPTYQVQSGCAGAVQAFELADVLLAKFERGLVIGGDVCARHFEASPDLQNAASSELINYMLFGDGAGAAVVSSNEADVGLCLSSLVHETTVEGGSAGQVVRWYGQADFANEKRPVALMEDYKAIEKLVPKMAQEVLETLVEQTGWTKDSISYLLPPQLAGHITDRISAALALPDAKAVNVVADTGNCGNGLPFFQLHQVFDQIMPGERMLCICIESSMWIKGGLALERTSA